MRNFHPSDRFQEPIQILDGPLSRGVVRALSETKQPNFEFSAEKTILRTRRDSLIQTGHIVERVHSGLKYLVCDHTLERDYAVKRLLLVDRKVVWKRSTSTLHPLTGKPISSTQPTQIGEMWVLWDMIRREAPDFVMHLAEEKNLVVTGADVQLNDWLDDQQVKRVNKALGVNIVQVQ